MKINGTSIIEKKINVVIQELNLDEEIITNEEGIANLNVTLDKIQYWSDDNPYLYKVILRTKMRKSPIKSALEQ